MQNKVLVVAAHPDDETLGCGGTIVKHKRAGDSVSVLVVAEGLMAREGPKEGLLELHSQSRRAVLEVLKADSLTILSYPDNKLDTVPRLNIIKDVESVVNSFKPNVVYTHFFEDLNIDHRIVYEAVLTACRPQSGVKEIYSFEVPSSTELGFQAFRPGRFVVLGNELDIKLKALETYKDEIREFPHTRSRLYLQLLAGIRGATVGVSRAEAFEVIRQIND